jgi:hypothetical protein
MRHKRGGRQRRRKKYTPLPTINHHQKQPTTLNTTSTNRTTKKRDEFRGRTKCWAGEYAFWMGDEQGVAEVIAETLATFFPYSFRRNDRDGSTTPLKPTLSDICFRVFAEIRHFLAYTSSDTPQRLACQTCKYSHPLLHSFKCHF